MTGADTALPAEVPAKLPAVLLVLKGLDIGGIERLVVDLATALARRGAVVEVAVVNDRRDQLIGAHTIVLPHGIDPLAIAAAAEARTSRSSPFVTAITVASHRDPKNYPNLLRGVRAAIDRGAALRVVAVGEGPAWRRIVRWQLSSAWPTWSSSATRHLMC